MDGWPPRMGNARRMSLVDFEFEGPVVEWRGLPPFYFLRIPEDESADIKFAAREIEYWGPCAGSGEDQSYRVHDRTVSQGRPLSHRVEGRGEQGRGERS